MDIQMNEVVWAKISGYPEWPAKVDRIYGIRNQMCEIVWFNDYRRTKLHKGQLKNFVSDFENHRSNIPNYIGLEAAIKEALMYLASQLAKKRA